MALWTRGRRTALADFVEELEALDTEFFAYPHDLTELLFTYVSIHPEEFGTLPEPS